MIFFLGVLFFSIVPLVEPAESSGPGAGPPPVVTVAPVMERDVNPPAEYVGHVEAVQAVDLRARVEGFLEQINFKEGEVVSSGKLLYLIEQAPYQAKVAADKARIAQAEAEVTRATQHLNRLRAARPESIPATDMDSSVAAQLGAKALLAEAQAALIRSELDLGYTAIKAPITGRIGRTVYTKGNLVNPASGPLARIVQIDPIRTVYSISENDLAAVQAALHDAEKGGESHILTPLLELANGEIYKHSGKVDFIDNQVDSSTGTIAVRAVFDNPEGLLIPGQYVTVLITRNKPRMMPVVPQAAVLVNQQGRFVLVVDNENRAVTRPITTGPEIGTFWGVESGLRSGEKIIIQGLQKVKPGQTVKIRTEQDEVR